jgi:hypothetical protein
MEPGSERITWKTIVGWLVLAAFIALFATPIAIWVGPGGQPAVVRIAAGFFCAVIVYRLVVVIRAAALIGQITPAEIAMQPRRIHVQIDPSLAGLVKELPGGLWWTVLTPALWTRLLRLCQQRGVAPPPELMPQSDRHPTRQDAERLIDFLEEST